MSFLPLLNTDSGVGMISTVLNHVERVRLHKAFEGISTQPTIDPDELNANSIE